MRLIDKTLFVLPLLATTQVLADSPRFPVPKGIPRDLDAILLIEPAPSHQISTIPSASQSQSHSPVPSPFRKHLDLRQVAAAQPAAAQPAAAKPAVANAAAATTVAQAAPAVAPVAAAPAAPAAGVGGAGAVPAAAQPTPGAQANPVTTIMVNTVVGGKTTQVPKVYTQTFGAATSAPPVQSGQIGLGTLTGKVGVVKTQDAKSDAVAVGRNFAWGNVVVVMVAGVATLAGGLLGIARI